jgi:hypothetical protein
MKSQISKLIPKGEGYNIAEHYKNNSKKELFLKYAKESRIKHTRIKCKCCSEMVLGLIVETGGVKDPIPLHMPCRMCDKWLGHLEVDNLKELKCMCLECFEEELI